MSILYQFIARIIKKDLGIHFKFHNLRHTYATVPAGPDALRRRLL